MANTLENSIMYSVLRQTMPANELVLHPPVPMHLSPGALSGALSNNIDIKAPGVREQMYNPSFPFFGPYRSSLYQHNNQTSVNNAPIPNYEDAMALGPTPSWLYSDWHRRNASAWFDILQETPVKESWQFRNYSNYITPYTGFTAFSQLRPHTTLGSFL